MAPTRVLLLHTHPVQYLAPLFARYAQEEGIEIVVAYWSLRLDAQHAFDADFQRHVDWGLPLLDGYTYVELADKPRLRRTRGLLATWKLVATGRFDLVVAYGYSFPAAWVSLISAKLHRSGWVFLADNHRRESARGRRSFGKGILLTVLGAVVDGVFAASVRSAAFYERFAPNKVLLIPHAIDDRRFAAAAASIGRKTSGATTFLFVGKLVANKRVQDAIGALGLLRDNSALWIVGSGPEEEALRALAAPLGDRVRFFGFRDQSEIPEVFAKADVVVLPSERETFGMVVSEGASVGCTAIVSDACGVVDSLVVNGVTGLVFPVGDAGALADAMARLTDPDLRERLATNMAVAYESWTASANVKAFVSSCLRIANEG